MTAALEEFTQDNQEQGEELAESAWDELGIEAGNEAPHITEVFRAICLRYAINAEEHSATAKSKSNYHQKARAYRFLCGIPLQSNKTYSASEILPILKPIEALNTSTVNPALRACSMLDISISSVETAQQMYDIPYQNYVLNVFYCLSKHVVRRRYSEFQALHVALAAKMPVIPELPTVSSWFFATSSTAAKDLVLYLNRVVTLLSARGVFSIDVMTFLGINFHQIRAQEEALAVSCLSSSSKSSGGGVLRYVISTRWLSKWKRFVTASSSALLLPGPIDNSDLFNDNNTELKEDLVLIKHYRMLSHESWRYFKSVYSGGPELGRTCSEASVSSSIIYQPAAYDTNGGLLILQKIARGFLGRRRANEVARKAAYNVTHPEAEERMRRVEEKRVYEATLNRIAQRITEQEQLWLNNAARTIQRAYRRFTLGSTSVIESRGTIIKPLLGDEKLLVSLLSLHEIVELRNPELRQAHCINTLLHSSSEAPVMTITRVLPGAFRKEKLGRVILSIDVEGSVLKWQNLPTSFNKQQRKISSILFSDIDSLMKVGQRLMISLSEKKSLVLQFDSISELEVLKSTLQALIHAVGERFDAEAQNGGSSYIDSRGVLRQKKPHAKPLLRKAKQILESSGNTNGR